MVPSTGDRLEECEFLDDVVCAHQASETESRLTVSFETRRSPLRTRAWWMGALAAAAAVTAAAIFLLGSRRASVRRHAVRSAPSPVARFLPRETLRPAPQPIRGRVRPRPPARSQARRARRTAARTEPRVVPRATAVPEPERLKAPRLVVPRRNARVDQFSYLGR
jgi:hypothetical protein